MGRLIIPKTRDYLYIASGAGLSPNINGLRFYDSGLIYYGKKSFYSEDGQYAIWYANIAVAAWYTGPIANIGNFTTNSWGKIGATDIITGSYQRILVVLELLTISEYKNNISIKKTNLGGGKISIYSSVIFNNTFNSKVDSQNTTWSKGLLQEITTAPAGCPNLKCLHLSQGYRDDPALYSQQGFGNGGMLDLTKSSTIECWFYVTNINTEDYAENGLFCFLRADGGDPLSIAFNGDRSITVLLNNFDSTGYKTASTNSSIFNLSSWNHFAVTVDKSSVKTTIYINGVNRAAMNYATSVNGDGSNWGEIPNAAWEWGVGHDFDNGYDIYISNMRWTQKVLYTTNFTPIFTNFPDAQI